MIHVKFSRQERPMRNGRVLASVRPLRTAVRLSRCNAEKSSTVFAITGVQCALSSATRSVRLLHLSSCAAASQLLTIMPNELSMARWRALCKRRLDRAMHRSHDSVDSIRPRPCIVNTRPANTETLALHSWYGISEVGDS